MKEAVSREAVENFAAPDGVVFVKVDAATGEPVGPGQPKPAKLISECFKEGTAPVVSAPTKGDAETRARGG
jgi:membrane carboxypeptidase/penicillin-binding protein